MRVFLTSPWIPPEWIRAHGLQPHGIWTEENLLHGAASLTAGVCAFAEAAVQFAELNPGSAVIFSTACDQMRRGFDTTMHHGQHRTFLFNLPATWQTQAAGQLFRSELERLGQFLLALGGVTPSASCLRLELEKSNAARQRLLDLAPVSAAREFAKALDQFHRDGSVLPLPEIAKGNQVPLALVGGPFPSLHWKLLDEIESSGGRVVLNATKTGERSLYPPFELTAGCDPFEALVDGYCDHIADVFQRPNTRLYSWLKPRLASRQVRGIVLWHFTGCDLWRAEAGSLREAFGLPVLLLEAGGEPGNAPRELTRLQAFVETLQ